MAFVLLFSVFVIASCGLIYELVAGALASYLLGDSVTQFSIVIGAYLSAMGVGSYLSRYVTKNLVSVFVKVELLVGVLGGTSAAILFIIFEHAYSFKVALYFIVFSIGVLVGLEIPLLMRILKDRFEFSDLISKVLSFDYIGALAASILFPLLLVPYLGLVKTSFLFGMLNVLVALWTVLIFSKEIDARGQLRALAIALLIILTAGFVYSGEILSVAEAAMYPDRVIYAKSSPYQRIIVTKSQDEIRLFLNGHLQFSSRDEYRYHEALVHLGLSSVPNRSKVLVLGGGDGMALREILKFDDVNSVTLIDLDREITELFKQSELLSALNQDAFSSSRVRVLNKDAFLWLKENREVFDFIVVDFPDPTNYSLGKLYSTAFYKLLRNALAEDGLIVVQSTSPLLARQSFWCVNSTLQAAGFTTVPYHVYVPSFGEWGFVLSGKHEFSISHKFLNDLKFLSPEVVASLLYFPIDMAEINVDVNKLSNQILVRYYDREWSRYTS